MMKGKPFAMLPGILKAYGIGAKELSVILQRSQNTALSRIRNPEGFTLKELAALNKAGITAEDIRECIKF